jgi:hypothetical protein
MYNNLFEVLSGFCNYGELDRVRLGFYSYNETALRFNDEFSQLFVKPAADYVTREFNE